LLQLAYMRRANSYGVIVLEKLPQTLCLKFSIISL
jgi:hypothetical protein